MVSLAVGREVHVLLKKAAVFNRSSCKVASSSKFLTYVASWKKNPMSARLQSPILFVVSDSIGFHFRSREESRWGMWGCLWEKGGDGVAQEEGDLQLVQAPCMILNTPMRSSFLKRVYWDSPL
jgi:hypothetical protein